jgi:putative phosphoribosyl transferase
MLEVTTHRFADRHAAGRELAAHLSGLAAEDPIVLGLARGGVPVAYEVARARGAAGRPRGAQDRCARQS